MGLIQIWKFITSIFLQVNLFCTLNVYNDFKETFILFSYNKIKNERYNYRNK